MPLSAERPGVFQGRRFESLGWYVIDPSFLGYERDVKAEWDRITSSSNLTGSTRVFRYLSWGCTLLPVALVARFAFGRNLLEALGIGIAAALVVSTIVSLVIQRRWVDRLGRTEFEDDLTSVIPIDPAIVGWSTDSTAWPILWELSLELLRLQEIDQQRLAWGATSGSHAHADYRARTDAIAEELDGQVQAQRAKFLEVARWSGFDPALVLTDHPTSSTD